MTAGGAGLQSRLKRLVGVMTAAVMVVVAAVGCGSDEGSGDSSGQGTVTLEFAHKSGQATVTGKYCTVPGGKLWDGRR